MDEIGEKLDALLNDPKQFGKIAQLASSILGDGGDKSAPPSAPEPELDLDMGQLRRMMSALRGGGHDSANRHLLEAMKPYLAEKRRRKIDRAMKLARLASLAELAAEDLEGDDHVYSLSGQQRPGRARAGRGLGCAIWRNGDDSPARRWRNGGKRRNAIAV